MDNPFDSAPTEALTRTDASLINILTEMGTSSDKSQYTMPGVSVKFSDNQLEILHEQPLINAYCSAIPDAAISKPLEFNFGSKNGDLDAKKSSEIIDWLDDFHVLEKTARAQTYANVYGGAAIVYFVDDGQPQDEPLNLKKVKKLLGTRVLDRQRVIPYIETATTLEDISHYDVSTHGVKIGIPGVAENAQIRFHKSRIIPFYGLHLTDNAMLQRYNGWGKSMIEAIWESYRDYRTAILASSGNLGDSSLAIVSMDGFIEMLRANDTETIKSVFASVKNMASNQGMMLIDKTKQDIRYVERQFTGVSQVIDKLREDFIGNSRIQHDKLFGESPSGLGATGEAEEKNWAKEVRQFQERRLRRLLRKQYEILLSLPDSPLKGKMPEQWSFKFPSIIELGEDQELANRATQSTIDSTYQSLGILTTDEIRQSRFAGSKFSYETTLDEKAYEEAKKKAEEEAAGYGGFGGYGDFGAGGEEQAIAPEQSPAEAVPEEEAPLQTDSRRLDAKDILYHDRNQYDLDKISVIANKKQEVQYPVSKLEWVLDYAGALTFERVKKADITKPLFVSVFKGRPVVIDGMHRLQQAKARGIAELPAKILTKQELESTRVKKLERLDAMRPSCMDCVTKHLGSALIKGREVENGYPEHIILVVGELSEAEQEVEAISQEAANMIRDLRRDCWARRRSPMFEEVLAIYDVLGYDWGNEEGDDFEQEVEVPSYRVAFDSEQVERRDKQCGKGWEGIKGRCERSIPEEAKKRRGVATAIAVPIGLVGIVGLALTGARIVDRKAEVSTSQPKEEQGAGFKQEGAELKQWAKENGEELTEEEARAITSYRNVAYNRVNTALRRDDFGDLSEADKSVVKGLDTGLKKLPRFDGKNVPIGETGRWTGTRLETSPVYGEADHLIRVAGLPRSVVEEYQGGQIVTEKGYLSTTTFMPDRQMKGFGLGLPEGSDTTVVYEIKWKREGETKAHWVNEKASVAQENEVLFERGTSFKVISIEETDYRLHGTTAGYRIKLQEV